MLHAYMSPYREGIIVWEIPTRRLLLMQYRVYFIREKVGMLLIEWANGNNKEEWQ